MRAGGFSDDKILTDNELALLSSMKESVESKVNQSFTTFKALSFQTQVVAGTNYLFKVDVGQERVLLVKIHQPLPHTNAAPVLMSVEG